MFKKLSQTSRIPQNQTRVNSETEKTKEKDKSAKITCGS